MDKYRIKFTANYFDDDGNFTIPGYDISRLLDDPRIEVGVIDNRAHVDAAEIVDVDALIATPTAAAITADSFPPDCRLAVIARVGVGYENVDVPACNANGGVITIAADAVRRPTAAGTMALILAATTRLLTKDRLTRLGPDGWGQKNAHPGMGLEGRTLGVVGLGNVGAEVVRLATPFDLKFIAYDPYVDRDAAAALGVRMVDDLDELMAQSDIVALHCLVTDETRGMIDAGRLALMKPTAYLINAARGPVVDQAALTEVLAAGRIAGAGLDVFDPEPVAADDPLLKLDNVVLSGHGMNWTDQLMVGFGKTNVDAVLAVMQGRAPRSVVNSEVLDEPLWQAKAAALRAMFGEG
jgi:phosphoglycerate dehydrogenase-like enzyme